MKLTITITLSLFYYFSFSQWIINHSPIFQPDFAKPSVGSVFTDPKFGTPVMRLTNAFSQSVHGFVPDYSKRQAWNSDESLMILRTGWGETYLYNGQTYQFIKTLDALGGEDIFWSPSNPDLILFNPDSVLYSYSISNEQVTQLHAFTQFTWANTRGEGNLSNDGRYYAVAGQIYNYTSGEVSFHDIVVYDIQNNVTVSSMPIPQDSIWGFDWVSVSPLGNYVVIDYADEETGRYHGVEVYDRDMNFIWQKPLGAGHSDLGIDATGDEVLVMDIYDSQSNTTIFKKFRLSDGQTTELLTISPLFDQHISCRNQLRNEWCLISTFDYVGRLTDDSLSWLPFEDEIFALKLDGSGDVQRIAHHHSRRFSPTTPDSDNSNYWAEPHATFSRNGDRIIFASNWRQDVNLETSVDAYLIDLRNLVYTDVISNNNFDFIIYPNPSSKNKQITLNYKNENLVKLSIIDVTGKIISEIVPDSSNKGSITFLPESYNIKPGIYFLQITSKTMSETTRLIILD